ncbi:MAG TPA: hypothetical protein VF628_01250 [Allosphingosinicella sp.]|jgi:hypothetical protein
MEEFVEMIATRDDNGETTYLRVYQHVTPAGTFQDPHATIKGLKRIETEAGDAVNYINPETYKVVTTGNILRRVPA